MRKMDCNISNRAFFPSQGGGNFVYISNLEKARRDWPGNGPPRLFCFVSGTTVPERRIKREINNKNDKEMTKKEQQPFYVSPQVRTLEIKTHAIICQSEREIMRNTTEMEEGDDNW